MTRLTGSPDNYIDYFRRSPIFDGLSGEEIELFLKNSKYELYRLNSQEEVPLTKGCSIFTLSGALSTYVTSEDGDRRLINMSLPDNPLIPIYDVKPLYTVSVCAKRASIALVLSRSSFMETNPSLLLIQHTIQRNVLAQFYIMSTVIMEKAICVTETSARGKIMQYIGMLCKEQNSLTVTLPLTRSDLADHLQMDKSTLARELKQMKTDNIIDYDKKSITLKNPEML